MVGGLLGVLAVVAGWQMGVSIAAVILWRSLRQRLEIGPGAMRAHAAAGTGESPADDPAVKPPATPVPPVKPTAPAKLARMRPRPLGGRAVAVARCPTPAAPPAAGVKPAPTPSVVARAG